jgi:hypothetical protein
MSDDPDDLGFQFVVYNPPAPGLPWLSVCLNPSGAVVRSEAWVSFEEAQHMAETAARTLAGSIEDETAGRPKQTSPTAKH